MTEHEPARLDERGIDADDALAVRLRVAHKMLASLAMEPEAKIRLQVRFVAICTALKLPGASKARGARRLDRLIAAAERAADAK